METHGGVVFRLPARDPLPDSRASPSCLPPLLFSRLTPHSGATVYPMLVIAQEPLENGVWDLLQTGLGQNLIHGFIRESGYR